MAAFIPTKEKAIGDLEHRQHADEKSSDSDLADANEVTWTEREEKAVRNKVSTVDLCTHAARTRY